MKERICDDLSGLRLPSADSLQLDIRPQTEFGQKRQGFLQSGHALGSK